MKEKGGRRMNPNGKYDEIMGLAHHVSKTRPQMPMADRAAQFAQSLLILILRLVEGTQLSP